MGLIKRRKKSSIDNISLKSKRRSGVMTGGALGVAAGAVAGAAAGIFNKKRKGNNAPIVDNGVTNVNEKHTDEIIENNVPKVETTVTETIEPKEDIVVEDSTLNNNNSQPSTGNGTLNITPEVKEDPVVKEEPKVTKEEPKVKEEPRSFVIEDGPDEKKTTKSEEKPKTTSKSTTKHEKFKSSDKDTSSKKITTGSTKKEDNTKSEEHTAKEEPKQEKPVVEEKSPVKEAEETPTEEKVVEEKSPVKEVEEKVEEITPEGEIAEEKTEVKKVEPEDEEKNIEETRSTLVSEPAEQDYLLITTGEIENNISKINTAVSSVKDVWDGLINTDLKNLEKSWAGLDAEVYIAKIKELSPKMDSIVQALELLSKTYKQTIDIANEAIEKNKQGIENTNE